MSECKYCKGEIKWERIDGKNIAINPDGTKHTSSCPSLKKGGLPQKKEGILISHHGNGCLIRMENGDRTFAIEKSIALPEGQALPQKIEFAVNDRNFIIDYKLLGPVEKPPVNTGKEILKENLARAPVASPPPHPPTPAAPQAASTSPSQPRMWSGETTLSIGVTINLEHYESLKITVTGAAADREQLKEFLNETLDGMGKTEATRQIIQLYKVRVMG